MNILTLLIYINIIISSLLVISSKNGIHSVFYLILTFFNASALLIIFNVEFLALIFIIIYVGAIAVLFLFIVMMLNVKLIELDENLIKYLPLGSFISIIFILEFISISEINSNFFSINEVLISNNVNWIFKLDYLTNLQLIGQLLYTFNVLSFLLASLILFIAMIGAIMLTLNLSIKNTKKQDIYKQLFKFKTL